MTCLKMRIIGNESVSHLSLAGSTEAEDIKLLAFYKTRKEQEKFVCIDYIIHTQYI